MMVRIRLLAASATFDAYLAMLLDAGRLSTEDPHRKGV
jgi:hypothetical protein